MTKFYPIALLGVFLSTPALAQDAADQADYSYAVGLKIAERMLLQGNDDSISLPELGRAIYDALSGNETRMTLEDAEALLLAEETRLHAQAAAKAETEGKAWRDEFAARDGVRRTDSGLLIAVIESGDADGESPGASDEVVVHYEGRLIDDSVFDSSYARNEPATFPVGGVIPGWQEALALMRPGDKWTVVIPPDLAYGEIGTGGGRIGPNATLVFDMHLLEIK